MQTSALLRLLSQPLEDQVDDLLADGVVAPRVVVGGVLLAGDQLLGVEELPVGPSPNLFQVEYFYCIVQGSITNIINCFMSEDIFPVRPLSCFIQTNVNMLSLNKERQVSEAENIHLVNDTGLQVHKDRPWDVFPCPGLGEESIETVVRFTQGGVGRHQTVGMNPMFQAVQFPAIFGKYSQRGKTNICNCTSSPTYFNNEAANMKIYIILLRPL